MRLSEYLPALYITVSSIAGASAILLVPGFVKDPSTMSAIRLLALLYIVATFAIGSRRLQRKYQLRE